MDDAKTAYDQLINRFIQWAQREDNVRTAVVVGSRARLECPADEWSDLDILLFANDSEPYWQAEDWVHQIGRPWLIFTEPTPDGQGVEWRVLFEGGWDADLIPGSVDGLQAILGRQVWTPVVALIWRGVRILVDKDGYSGQLRRLATCPSARERPTQAEFLNVVSDFWFHAVWTAKKLRRGELWTAKGCSDHYMKERLLQVVEWHALATAGWRVDVWHGGRFLEQWASPRFVSELRSAFACYDRDDLWRGLRVTMDLFRWLAQETAERLEFPYPTAADEHVTGLVRELFSARLE